MGFRAELRKFNGLLRLQSKLLLRWFKQPRPHSALSEKEYAEQRFLTTFGRPLNLQHPATFNEKLQWLKLYNRRAIMITLADKYGVREYVSRRVGEEYLNPLLGVYVNVEQFLGDLQNLPDRFVIKTTHGSGWDLIVADKSMLSSKDLDQLRNWLATNYYSLGREWCYKSIHPKIICEQYIEPKDLRLGLLDYKFFCFRGQPEFIQVDIDRSSNHRRNFYDLSWNLIPVELVYQRSDKLIPEPDRLGEMIKVARRLSGRFAFIRVDLYSEQQVIFGEITFYPNNGFGTFTPEEYDYSFGKLLELPRIHGGSAQNQWHT